MRPTTFTMDVNFTLPMATVIRDGTAKVHDDAQRNPGAFWLVKGALDKNQYIRLLMALWHVYW